MARLVAYLRVSTDGQRDNTSFAAQMERIEAYASCHQHDLVLTCEDVETASGKRARPGLQRALEVVKHDRADGIISSRLDRFARSAIEGLTLAQELRLRGKQLVLLDINLDTSTALGECMFTMLLAFAAMERNIINERLAAGRDHSRKQGGWASGALPYGYTSEKQGSIRRLVPVPEEQAVIQRILQWRSDGMCYLAIANKLNSLAIPTKRGAKWSRVHVRDLCQRDSQAEYQVASRLG